MAKKKTSSKKKSSKRAPSKKSTPKKKEEFFVSIAQPQMVQVPILESRKGTLKAMRVFQELKQIRKQKIHERAQLRKQVRLIISTINKIKTSIPHVDIPSDDIPKVPVKQVSRPKPVAKPKTELDSIEDGLAKIERKLASLSR